MEILFFALGKALAKKDCNGKRGFVKKCSDLALDFLQNTPKISKMKYKRIGTDCFVPRNDR